MYAVEVIGPRNEISYVSSVVAGAACNYGTMPSVAHALQFDSRQRALAVIARLRPVAASTVFRPVALKLCESHA